MLVDPSIGARHGTGRVRVMDLASLRSLSLAFVLSPRALSGLRRGRCEFMCIYPILGSSQPEGLSFVACPDRSGSKTSSVSSLTGVIEWNLGPSFVTGST